MSENRDVMQAQADRIAELEETVRRKQALAEERQELLNTWQAEKEQALAELTASKQETGRIREALETAENRMQGYEKQFAALQQTAAETEELRQQLAVAAAETEELRRQLQETTEKAARERSLRYRIRDKLDKQTESNDARH